MSLFLLLTVLVNAQPAESPDAAALAKPHFTAGQTLYEQRKFLEAAAEFEKANRLRPHPVTVFNLARCYESLEANGKALAAYSEYLRLSPQASDKATVVDSIANLERKLREKGVQQVRILAEPTDAKVEIDDKDLGSSPTVTELRPGNHALRVSAKGMQSTVRNFELLPNKSLELTVVLQPVGAPIKSDAPLRAAELRPGGSISELKRPPEAAPPKKGKPLAWIVSGVAVAGLGTGIVLGVTADGAAKNLRGGSLHTQQEATALDKRSRSMAMGANISYAVAAAAGVTAVILFIFEGQP